MLGDYIKTVSSTISSTKGKCPLVKIKRYDALTSIACLQCAVVINGILDAMVPMLIMPIISHGVKQRHDLMRTCEVVRAYAQITAEDCNCVTLSFIFQSSLPFNNGYTTLNTAINKTSDQKEHRALILYLQFCKW